VYARRFDKFGTALGAPFRVDAHPARNSTAPAISINTLGEIVVVW
jgi:hypothetical protein